LVAEGAHEAARVAGKLPNPLFDFRVENWSPASGAPDRDVFALGTQPFELGGKRSLRRELAISERDAAAGSVRSLERSLALDTVRAYVGALRARALLETLIGNRDGLKTIVDSMNRRVDEGYSAEADLLKFKTEAARIDVDIVRAQLELTRGLTSLAIAIGAPARIEASQLVEPEPLTAPNGDAALVAASVARHPDVLAAKAGFEHAQRLTAYERARRIPDAAVTGGYKRTAGFNTVVFGVTLSVPVFDRNQAGVARAFGIERGADADRDALVQRLTIDAIAVVGAAQAISARAERTAQELLAPAEEVRRAALAAFREGSTDVLKLIDAERVYAEVRKAAVDLRLDALLATIEARFALGEETIP
jgi:cobalt-zinc-cadmium efflux system outer membrane protein